MIKKIVLSLSLTTLISFSTTETATLGETLSTIKTAAKTVKISEIIPLIRNTLKAGILIHNFTRQEETKNAIKNILSKREALENLTNKLKDQLENNKTTDSLLTVIEISKILSENIPDLIYLSKGTRAIAKFVAEEILPKLRGKQFQEIKNQIKIINITTEIFEKMAEKSMPLIKTALKAMETTLKAKGILEGFMGMVTSP